MSSLPLLQRLLSRSLVDQIALTPGAASAVNSRPNELIVEEASKIISKFWRSGSVLIVVGAIGAVVRLVAPLLVGKESDPAVLVIDAKASHIVPLLGGHQSGAEELALQLADQLGGNSVITGDCKTQARLAIDCFGEAWGWKRSGRNTAWHQMMVAQSQGKCIAFNQSSGSTLWQKVPAAINGLSPFKEGGLSESLNLEIGPYLNGFAKWHPPTLWIGVGCERGTSFNLVTRSIEDSLKTAGLASEAVAGIATIDKKSDEEALLAFVEGRQWAMRMFSAESLAKVDVPNPSEIVEKEMLTSSVAEAAALLAAGPSGVLNQTKKIFHSLNDEQGAITIAIAESQQQFAPNRGELHLVGIGPGDLSLLTNDARSALTRSVVWVGYDFYLDFLEPLLREDQIRVNSKITQEHSRCEQALELAIQGMRVALVSSGDSGIYGMAGLALELWLKKAPSQRPTFQVYPGISAFQLVSAKVGAPLMHDFCAISLSDRLTPWHKIETRLKAAAAGDFVVALYNPRSSERYWQLSRAIELLSEHRAADTPTVLARQVGRPQEHIEIYTLESFPIDQVDMLSLVLIGNTGTLLKDGRIVTPRGYNLESIS